MRWEGTIRSISKTNHKRNSILIFVWVTLVSTNFFSTYLPDSNLNAILLDPYWRMWSICHLTMRCGSSSSVKRAMWNRFLSKSRRISSRHCPLNAKVLALRRRTRKVSSSGITVWIKGRGGGGGGGWGGQGQTHIMKSVDSLKCNNYNTILCRTKITFFLVSKSTTGKSA